MNKGKETVRYSIHLKSIVLLAVGLMTTQIANADCLERVASFAAEICGEIDKTGKREVTDVHGNVDAGVKGIITRIVGDASAEVGGKKLVDVYENVVREELAGELFNVRDCRINMVEVGRAEACRRPVVYKPCRHPDFGRVGWQHTQDFSGSSGWRSGGTSQPDWCRALANSLINQRSIGPQHEVQTVSSSEDGRWTGIRHRQYNYHCTVRISWGPVYAERADPRCGVVEASR